MVEFLANLFRQLPKFFTGADLWGKQLIVGSIFPDKLIFEEKKYRSIRENGLLTLMCSPSKDSGGKVKKITPENGGNSSACAPDWANIQPVFGRFKGNIGF